MDQTTISLETLELVNSMTLEESASLLDSLSSQELQQLVDTLEAYPWLPNPGPQTDAYFSLADELFYGGAAGGGKSDLLLGLALNEHKRSAIFRREIAQLKALEDRLCEIIPRKHYAANPVKQARWQGRILEFGGCQRLGDEQAWQGRPHDLKGFDELPHFLREQFIFLNGWKRTTDPNQRTRTVGAGNPPTDDMGRWIVEYWRPWLDSSYPVPAKPGELRYFFRKPGDKDAPDIEVEAGYFEDLPVLGRVYAKSRTFVPARLSDNPQLLATDYGSQLNSMPEPLRSQLLYGDFDLKVVDRPWQLIPTAWVIAAQARWSKSLIKDRPIEQIGGDIARSQTTGGDKTVLYPRHQNVIFPALAVPGNKTPDGGSVTTLIIQLMGSQFGTDAEPLVTVDGAGVGSSVVDHCKMVLRRFQAINASNKVPYLDKTRKFRFVNMRAYMWWLIREALDPDQANPLALPPDPYLVGDLTGVDWKVTASGIQIEDKDKIKARIGRSPDHGEALAISLCPGAESGQGMIDFMLELAKLEQAKREAASKGGDVHVQRVVNDVQASVEVSPKTGGRALMDWHESNKDKPPR